MPFRYAKVVEFREDRLPEKEKHACQRRRCRYGRAVEFREGRFPEKERHAFPLHLGKAGLFVTVQLRRRLG